MCTGTPVLCVCRCRAHAAAGQHLAKRVGGGCYDFAEHQLAVDDAQRAHVLQVDLHVIRADAAVARAARLIQPCHLPAQGTVIARDIACNSDAFWVRLCLVARVSRDVLPRQSRPQYPDHRSHEHLHAARTPYALRPCSRGPRTLSSRLSPEAQGAPLPMHLTHSGLYSLRPTHTTRQATCHCTSHLPAKEGVEDGAPAPCSRAPRRQRPPRWTATCRPLSLTPRPPATPVLRDTTTRSCSLLDGRTCGEFIACSCHSLAN